MLRGATRYYLAAGLARDVIESWRFSIEPGDTDPMRQGALAAAGPITVQVVASIVSDSPLLLGAGSTMRWTNWHAGLSSDMVRTLDVRGYPTHLLIDADGTILARNIGLRRLRALIEATVDGRRVDSARLRALVLKVRRVAGPVTR